MMSVVFQNIVYLKTHFSNVEKYNFKKIYNYLKNLKINLNVFIYTGTIINLILPLIFFIAFFSYNLLK